MTRSRLATASRLWLSAALTLAAVLALAAPASATGPKSHAERAFLVDMVGHHAMAVEMAQMAKEKATHPELKSMADDIIRSQSAEITTMRTWLKRWYGRSVSPGHMGHDADMMKLEQASGAQFEVRWMAIMIMHHTQAIERAHAVRKYPVHSQVRRLTRDIIRAQTKEIGELQDWLVAWYAK